MRRRVLIVVALVAVLSAACVPPPEDPPPTDPRTWVPTVRDWSTDPAEPREVPYSATTRQWWAVIEMTDGWDGPATLNLHRRGGEVDAPNPVPEFTFTLPNGASDLAMDDHVIAVRGRSPVDGSIGIELFELEGDAWSHAATVTRPDDATRQADLAVTDDHLVIGERAVSQLLELPGRVVIVPITLAGPGISWSEAQVQTLAPDPTWPEHARNGFGGEVSIVGAVLAVATDWDRVAMYLHDGTGWPIDQVLTSSVPLGSSGMHGRSISVDASGQPRVAVGSGGGFTMGVPQPGRVDIYRRSPAGWAVERSIAPRPGSALSGFGMGSMVVLDGDRLATSAHWTQVPRPGDVGLIDDLRLEVHDLRAVPTFQAELSVLEALGGPATHPTSTFVGASSIQLAGDHLAVNGLVSFGADPAHHAAISYDLG